MERKLMFNTVITSMWQITGRSNPVQRLPCLDCFVVSLLAMTRASTPRNDGARFAYYANGVCTSASAPAAPSGPPRLHSGTGPGMLRNSGTHNTEPNIVAPAVGVVVVPVGNRAARRIAAPTAPRSTRYASEAAPVADVLELIEAYQSRSVLPSFALPDGYRNQDGCFLHRRR
jgi:hypothetical protein